LGYKAVFNGADAKLIKGFAEFTIYPPSHAWGIDSEFGNNLFEWHWHLGNLLAEYNFYDNGNSVNFAAR